jgi:hypothetical protein
VTIGTGRAIFSLAHKISHQKQRRLLRQYYHGTQEDYHVWEQSRTEQKGKVASGREREREKMEIPMIPSQQDNEAVAVMVIEENDVENSPQQIIVTEVPVVDNYEVEKRKAAPSLLMLALLLVGYTLVQYYAVTWSFANIFVGILGVTLFSVLACCTSDCSCCTSDCCSSQNFQQPCLMLTAFIVSAAYCGILACILFRRPPLC